jgi:hypothetical protein
MRYTAAYVVGEKKVPLANELIELLKDRNTDVQQMARRSLILLACQANSKNVDNQKPSTPLRNQVNRLIKYGPNPTSSKRSVETASKRWTEWWEDNDPELENLRAALSPGEKREAKKK